MSCHQLDTQNQRTERRVFAVISHQNALRIPGCYNTFQMIFDELLNLKGNKRDCFTFIRNAELISIN